MLIGVLIGAVVGITLTVYIMKRRLALYRDARDGLRPYAERLRDLQDFWYEGTGDPFLIVDAGANVKSLNPSARRLLGLAAEPVAGRPLSAFLREDCEAFAVVRGTLESGVAVYRKEVKVRPVRTPETAREVTIRPVDNHGTREAWVLIRAMGG